jgi:hypothetical protein
MTQPHPENISGESLWAWLSEHTNLALDYDWPVEGGEGEWQVHRVTGNVNDREWELIGTGETAFGAVEAARSLLSTEAR